MNSTAVPPAVDADSAFALAAAPPLEPHPDRFYFLRHGQTEGNFRRIYQRPDALLNETGRRQARAAAERLRSVEFREIFCSDYRRACETAETIARVTGRPLTVVEDLRERFFGDLIGTSSVGLDWAADPPGGETLAEFVERTKRGLQRILGSSEEPPPLIVAHGGTLRVLVAALGAAVDEAARENAVPLVLGRGAEGWRVERL